MARSSKLEPEVRALVDQAERVRLAVEAMVDVVEPRQSQAAYIETHGYGKIGRRNHERFTCAGQETPLWAGGPDQGWCTTADGAGDALIRAAAEAIKANPMDQTRYKLVWRKTPEIWSITSEIGDLFNGNMRLSVVPADWIVSFPEQDNEAPAEPPMLPVA